MDVPEKEILIVKNPIFYKEIAPNAFESLIKDGSWIPLVFNAIEKVVKARFFALCELNWDYLRDLSSDDRLRSYGVYKSIYFNGIDDNELALVKETADEIEEEIRLSAEEALLAENEEQD